MKRKWQRPNWTPRQIAHRQVEPLREDGCIVNGCLPLDDYAEDVFDLLLSDALSFDTLWESGDMPVLRYDERAFRIKANDAVSAREKLENYIRANAVTSGRLHIADITADENQSGDGFFMGRVSYANPDTHASRDKMNGIVPSYGGRISANKNSISTERVFELRGFANYDAAYTALKNNYGWYSDVDSIDVEENSEGAFQLYTGRVKYLTEKEEENTPQNSVSFEVSGTQTKMTHSLRTRSGFAASGNPRNYGGLIGVTDDGVEGVDVDTAVSTFTETVHFKPWFLTTQYIAFLGRAYGCVNTAPFRGFSDGEVRFLGASGSYRRGDKSVEMTFKFAVSPNARNIRIGEMTIPFKYGWDYLWVRWADMKKGNITVKTPVEAYVEQVYHGLNFGTLGIGF
ncbi:MAG: hypothetical protein ACRC2T_18810 [Thermoguttaceae bacterium]